MAELQAGMVGWAQTGFENWRPWLRCLGGAHRQPQSAGAGAATVAVAQCPGRRGRTKTSAPVDPPAVIRAKFSIMS